MSGAENDLVLVQRYLPTYTLAELNGLARSWATLASRVLVVTGPDTMQKPKAEDLQALMQRVQSRPLAAYDDRVPPDRCSTPHRVRPPWCRRARFPRST